MAHRAPGIGRWLLIVWTCRHWLLRRQSAELSRCFGSTKPLNRGIRRPDRGPKCLQRRALLQYLAEVTKLLRSQAQTLVGRVQLNWRRDIGSSLCLRTSLLALHGQDSLILWRRLAMLKWLLLHLERRAALGEAHVRPVSSGARQLRIDKVRVVLQLIVNGIFVALPPVPLSTRNIAPRLKRQDGGRILTCSVDVVHLLVKLRWQPAAMLLVNDLYPILLVLLQALVELHDLLHDALPARAGGPHNESWALTMAAVKTALALADLARALLFL